ncbi:MAG: bifunctional oligoribonuclease/PAP phosphatase NrnA [Candidatus Omnitrophica bacterium]|nr:bifunctional oligoribonuclease/PAP phosphatase NrnA [Candidatus Omnitrophota bacterium]
MSLKKAAEAIKKYSKFLITAHTSLEGDALGSELAFYMLLRKLGKEAYIVNEDGIPYEYGFLPRKEIVRKFDKGVLRLDFDCFVALDCSDLRRTGEVYKLNSKYAPVINIDHHISNEMFGDVNWVDPHSSSASEMIYRLYKYMHIAFTDESALFLYVGIFTDTGSFRYSNTTSFTHKAASELLKFKISVPQVYNNVYGNIPYQDIKALTRIFPNLKLESAGKIAWVQIERAMLKESEQSFDIADHVLSFARAIRGVEVVVLFRHNLGVKDEIRINFRSQGKVDVNKIAKEFGGGGHKTASGATVRGDINQVRRKVLSRIKEEVSKL